MRAWPEKGRKDSARMQREVVNLRRRIRVLAAVVGLLVSLVRALGGGLARRRVRDNAKKRSLLRAIERGRAAIPLASVLRTLGLSAARYHDCQKSINPWGNPWE